MICITRKLFRLETFFSCTPVSGNSKQDRRRGGQRRFISIQYRRNARVNFVKYVRQHRGLRLRLYTAEEGTEEIQGRRGIRQRQHDSAR